MAPLGAAHLKLIERSLATRDSPLTPTLRNRNRNRNRRRATQCHTERATRNHLEPTTKTNNPDEPLTVFVPSNEALRKIPDDELEVIKNNSTALRGECLAAFRAGGRLEWRDLRAKASER